MKHGRQLFALVAAIALLGAGTASAQAPPPDFVGAHINDGEYYIVGNDLGFNSQMCLDVPGWATEPNVPIQLFPIRPGQGNQLWRVRRQADGFYQIVNAHSGLALDVPDASMNAGVHIQQFPPHDGDNQRWRFDMTLPYSSPDWRARPAFARIVSKRSGLALDVPNGDYAVHQRVQQFTPHAGWNQTWLLIPQ